MKVKKVLGKTREYEMYDGTIISWDDTKNKKVLIKEILTPPKTKRGKSTREYDIPNDDVERLIKEGKTYKRGQKKKSNEPKTD